MIKCIWITLIAAMLQLLACSNPAGYQNNTSEVAIIIKASAQPNSTYKITITAADMETIGPKNYSGGQTVELYVTPGNDRVFRIERYNQNSLLTDSCTTTHNIEDGKKNTITFELKPNNYLVSFDSRGGIPVPKSRTVKCGDTVENPDLIMKKIDPIYPDSGYKFEGWCHDSGCLNPWSFSNDKVTGTTTLYAQWKHVPSYIITYDGNGNCGGIPPLPQFKIQDDTTVKISSKGDLYRTNYHFVCWNDSSSGNGDNYYIDSIYRKNANITLYAKWVSDTTQ